jgi:hypothetical protein
MKQGETLYQNIRKGLNSKPMLVNIKEDINKFITNRDQDWYVSLYKYTDEHLQTLEEAGTLAGIKNTITNNLYFDFDNKPTPQDIEIMGSEKAYTKALEKTRLEALEVANRLVLRGFEEDNIGCYFTGGKGFSIEVEINEYITPEKFKAITLDIAGDLDTFDTVVADPNRIVRVSNTRHQNSGLYKIPLTPEELVSLSIAEIKLLAKNPRQGRMLKIANLPQNIKDIEPMKERAVSEIARELTFDISTVDMKARPHGLDEAKYLLLRGFFRTGQRNHAMLCLASTFKNLKYDRTHTEMILKATAIEQAERTGEDEFPDNEIELILNQVYSDHWKGGQFTIRDPQNWLAQYAVKMGLDIKKVEDGPMQIVDVEAEFTHFVKNLEQNTVSTGIPFIDAKMPLTLGTNAAIVGAPGSGKTTLALNILKNCSARGMTTVFFSLDMHRKRMFEKIMYDVTGLSRAELYEAFKSGKGKELVAKMKAQYGSVWFYDRSGTSPADMERYIKSVEEHTGTKVKLVMIDYLERVASEKSSDTEASKDIAQKIQDLVMDLDIACVTLVQPNKNAYNGGPDSPIENMAAIKGSSYLQQSYRNIISLWRPGYTPTLSEQGFDRFIEFAILKNDLGEMGKTVMGFEGAKGRIRPLEDFEYAEHKELLEYKRNLAAGAKNDGWE